VELDPGDSVSSRQTFGSVMGAVMLFGAVLMLLWAVMFV
jgi:hypothetical protein